MRNGQIITDNLSPKSGGYDPVRVLRVYRIFNGRLRVLQSGLLQWLCLSSPPKRGRHVSQDGFEHVRVVFHAKLVRDGQQQCVGFRDSLVFL